MNSTTTCTESRIHTRHLRRHITLSLYTSLLSNYRLIAFSAVGRSSLHSQLQV